ncbi:MAG TPA: S26 family signal peptidase [Egibacteraceae bacterium]|nr:S26 family signal peptidase [Egibacteraceae bacterium]
MLAAPNGLVAFQGGLSNVLAVMACMWSIGPCRVSIKGLSMAPTLLPGDHVLVHPSKRLRRRDLVVVADPSEPGRWVIKRVVALPGQSVVVEGRTLAAGEGIVLLGDNAERSTDSRHYGPVPMDAVHGRVWYRYAPAHRAGRV